MLDEEAAPPGPLDAAEPPPLMPPDEDAAPPPVPPVPDVLVSGELELELEGELGVVVDEEEDDPPGTMTVSFSFVVVEAEGAEPPGTTVVVSLRSQPESARAPTRTNR